MTYNWERRQALLWKHRRTWDLLPVITIYPPRQRVDKWIAYATSALGGALVVLLILGHV